MMKIRLQRITKPTKAGYTIGHMYIGDELICDTLEPENRLARGETKVKSKTAIPAGEYTLSLTYSNRFGEQMFYKQHGGGMLPLLNSVPGFSGVRIHCGNTQHDTEGCILVGTNNLVGKVTSSREAYVKVFNRIRQAILHGGGASIEILNP